MMGDWQTVSLGDALTFQRGFDITKDEQRDGPYPVISSSGPKTTHAEFKVRGPGVIIGRKGSLGTVFYSDTDYWPHDTTLWIKDFHGNHPRFAYYFLQTMGFERLDAGASNPSLNRNHIHMIPVLWPPLPVQQRIAGILSAYDELMENSQRRIRLLEAMARALYREWFVHFRFPGHEKHPRVASTLGDIPQGWAATTLGEFVSNGSISLQTGPFGTQLKASQYTDEGTPVINVRNIGFGVLKADKLEFLPPERAEEHKRHKLLDGDIVFGRKGAVERHLLVSPSEQGWIQGSDCIRLRVVSGPLTPRYLSIRFREEDHQRWMMNQCSGGATMASLNQDILCRIPLVVPAAEHLAAFDRFCASTLNQMDVLSSQIQNLRRTRDLLLPRLLSGQVELKVEESVSNIISLPLEKPEKKQKTVTDEFVEAVMISQLTRLLASDKYPLGRLRYNKLAYLAHRKSEDDVQAHYLKKAAGPYSPWAKYGGPEKIALQNGYVNRAKSGQLEGFVPGKNIGKIDQYLSHYPVCAAIDWVVKTFRYRKNDELELLATVDFAALDLLKQNAAITWQSIKHVIASNKEWAPKLERPVFSDDSIANAISELHRLFPNTFEDRAGLNA